ncbi:MAG: hypothetical protein ACXAEN_20260 [Candidatus Thorarchaeota archaeon]
MPEALSEKLDKRNTILNRLQEWQEEKSKIESAIFKQLVNEGMEHYLTINWRKLHTDNTRGHL